MENDWKNQPSNLPQPLSGAAQPACIRCEKPIEDCVCSPWFSDFHPTKGIGVHCKEARAWTDGKSLYIHCPHSKSGKQLPAAPVAVPAQHPGQNMVLNSELAAPLPPPQEPTAKEFCFEREKRLRPEYQYHDARNWPCEVGTSAAMTDPREIAQRIREVFMTRAKPDGIDEVAAILAAEMPRWVPVEEKDNLPQLGKAVLVASEAGAVFQAERQPYSSSNWDCWGWWISSGHWKSDNEIKAWQPLPSPPREEAP